MDIYALLTAVRQDMIRQRETVDIKSLRGRADSQIIIGRNCLIDGWAREAARWRPALPSLYDDLIDEVAKHDLAYARDLVSCEQAETEDGEDDKVWTAAFATAVLTWFRLLDQGKVYECLPIDDAALAAWLKGQAHVPVHRNPDQPSLFLAQGMSS